MSPMENSKRCGVCEDEKTSGIHLFRFFICSECETNMIHTEPREEKYQYYLHKLKDIHQPPIYS